MKEQRDTPRPTMSDEEMVKDYPRLAREYTLLHQDYREAIRKPLNIPDVSQQRELLIAYGEELEGRSLYLEGTTLDKFTDEYLSNL
jgi:hypothetical protein